MEEFNDQTRDALNYKQFDEFGQQLNLELQKKKKKRENLFYETLHKVLQMIKDIVSGTPKTRERFGTTMISDEVKFMYKEIPIIYHDRVR